MRRVLVTGIGAVTPFGLGIPSLWSGVSSGRCAIGPLTLFDPSAYRVQIAAEIPRLPTLDDPGAGRLSRSDRAVLIATVEAWSDSGLESAPNPNRLGVILGGGSGGTLEAEANLRSQKQGHELRTADLTSYPADASVDRVASLLGARGVRSMVVTACSSGAVAILLSWLAIRSGLYDVVVTGGVDTLNPLAFGGFNSLRALDTQPCRPFDKSRAGLSLGEGAAVLVLEAAESAQARGASAHCEVLGAAEASSAHHMTAPREDGDELIRAMRSALVHSSIRPEQVGYINAHGTGTRINDKVECTAIRNVFPLPPPVSSTKAQLGHCLCAAGAVEAIVTALAVEKGVLPPTIHLETPDPELGLDFVPNQAREQALQVALSLSLGFGGTAACLVLGKAS